MCFEAEVSGSGDGDNEGDGAGSSDASDEGERGERRAARQIDTRPEPDPSSKIRRTLPSWFLNMLRISRPVEEARRGGVRVEA